ncbi:hypothetical protein M422DRAFT_277160 [Sphaerobolus stellatus SS14]|uniref:Uncharacterized protein n=1 Tax=Sphaerobolus stellatus (strain SS14) TaxID=990650 RepID=A0A0C9TKR7_SPHS4|nr:hypothetical protein M422DRAFT_277160 [Sphaerobolus stellatus SS14]
MPKALSSYEIGGTMILPDNTLQYPRPHSFVWLSIMSSRDNHEAISSGDLKDIQAGPM